MLQIICHPALRWTNVAPARAPTHTYEGETSRLEGQFEYFVANARALSRG